MTEKVIGILGGMGPEATLGFFERIIAHTPATRDQEHLRVIIDSNPHVPDRTAAILLGGESPVPLMVAGVEALQRAGADFVVIPCVSAHFFLEELRRRVSLPVISMFDVTAEHIRRDHPRIKTVGLLGTTGTVAGGHFQARLAQDRIETVRRDPPTRTASWPRSTISRTLGPHEGAPRSQTICGRWPDASRRRGPRASSWAAPNSRWF